MKRWLGSAQPDIARLQKLLAEGLDDLLTAVQAEAVRNEEAQEALDSLHELGTRVLDPDADAKARELALAALAALRDAVRMAREDGTV